jgi:hypothetical protein
MQPRFLIQNNQFQICNRCSFQFSKLLIKYYALEYDCTRTGIKLSNKKLVLKMIVDNLQ